MNAKRLAPVLLAVLLTCFAFAANCKYVHPITRFCVLLRKSVHDVLKCTDCMQAKVATWRYQQAAVSGGHRMEERRWTGGARLTSDCV
jgi:hypothetical protein